MDEVEWEKFKVSEIFTVNTGSLVSKNKLTNGRFPRITASDLNNGIGLYTSLSCDKKQRWSENVVSYSFLGTSFFHPYKCSFDMKIHFLSPKSLRLDQNTGLFISSILKHFIYKPSYGHQVSKSDLLNKCLLLPVNNRHKPDWHYMEQYIINEIAKYSVPKLEKLKDSPDALNSVTWKPFKLGLLFSIIRGNSGPKNKLAGGNTPLVSAKKVNNGLDSLVKAPQKATLYKDVVSINTNGDGGAGIAYYHSYNFIATQDVSILEHKSKLTACQQLFIVSSINAQRKKLFFGFGNKLTSNRLRNLSIMLPSTESGEPNWQFMEDYIKSIPNSKFI